MHHLRGNEQLVMVFDDQVEDYQELYPRAGVSLTYTTEHSDEHRSNFAHNSRQPLQLGGTHQSSSCTAEQDPLLRLSSSPPLLCLCYWASALSLLTKLVIIVHRDRRLECSANAVRPCLCLTRNLHQVRAWVVLQVQGPAWQASSGSDPPIFLIVKFQLELALLLSDT